MAPLLITVLYILLFLVVCYLGVLIIERIFGPIDPIIKSIVGAVVLILCILYLMGGLPAPVWR
jgi:hypothetical protein